MGQHGAMLNRNLAKIIPIASIALTALVLLATITVPTTAAQAATRAPTYYVSLGDSYSVGFQPGLGSTPGYTVYVARHTRLTLVNFGCGGATTTSILNLVGCPNVLPHTVGGVTYPTTTQIAAAQAFISAHRGHIGLITVSIGGNDVTGCAAQVNPIPCVGTAVNNIKTNVTTLAGDLRTAAGPGVPIIGSTYPDVILGTYVFPHNPAPPSTVNLANLSVTAFKSLINPALSMAYASAGGSLVDVTAATGAYTSLNRTVKTKAYGTIPVPVASVCALTWFCTQGNIHARTPGYTLIGKLYVARYNKVKR
jgi:lysophospholipase L1-like esterase